jgi:hypothetical protein
VAEQRYKAVLAVISDGVPNDGEPASCSSG